jgi:predicted RNA-binding protein YlxR (DUF448 family)
VTAQSGLIRLALDGDRVTVDSARRRPGRGAYVCDAACAAAAVERRSLPRAFRRSVHTSDDFVESMASG